MKTTLTIIDNFAEAPDSLRGEVLASDFSIHRGPDEQAYRVSLHKNGDLVPLVEQALGRKITPHLSAFRLDLAGEMPGCPVHCDDIGSTHAAILYLNPPRQCRGGTAFWTHRALGIDAMPTVEEISAQPDPKRFASELHNDWKDGAKWEQSGFVGMKFNRFITYPTAMFHSRWPLEGFGSDKRDGRLIWVCFYDLKEAA